MCPHHVGHMPLWHCHWQFASGLGRATKTIPRKPLDAPLRCMSSCVTIAAGAGVHVAQAARLAVLSASPAPLQGMTNIPSCETTIVRELSCCKCWSGCMPAPCLTSLCFRLVVVGPWSTVETQFGVLVVPFSTFWHLFGCFCVGRFHGEHSYSFGEARQVTASPWQLQRRARRYNVCVEHQHCSCRM